MIVITDADREAAASITALVEMRELIRAGRADHHAEPFARHRLAAVRDMEAQLAEARGLLASIQSAMLNGGDGQIGDYGWSITTLNLARPLIRAFLSRDRQSEAAPKGQNDE